MTVPSDSVPAAFRDISGGVSPQVQDSISGVFWIVVDVRSSQHGVNSGISRFVVGIAQGLSAVLNRQSKVHWKLLLVGKQYPPNWVIDTVLAYPKVVSFWSGGRGALSSRFDRPHWLWPTLVFPEVLSVTGQNLFWIAPGNFDRPLLWPLLVRKSGLGIAALRSKILQVVHDVIPITNKASMGLLFRMQFRFLLKRTLSYFPGVATVSRHSLEQLKLVSPPGGASRLFVAGNGVSPLFGSQVRLRGEELHEQRMRLLFSQEEKRQTGELDSREGNGDLLKLQKLCRASSMAAKELVPLFEMIANKRWVLSVGGYQKYKCWDLACAAVLDANSRYADCLLIRIGYGYEEFLDTYKGKFSGRAFFGKGFVYLEQYGVLGLFGAGEEDLAAFYRFSDCLIHPSLAEGFGLPPLEAAVSGAPVIFSADTAVEEHFENAKLPKGFFQVLKSREPADWSAAILNVLNVFKSPSARDDELRLLLEACLTYSPRQVLQRYWNLERFSWENRAAELWTELKARARGIEMELLGDAPVAAPGASVREVDS